MKNFTQKFIAHHINPNAPAGGENIEVPSTHFTEPSMEQLVDLIESGEADKSILGENADRIINEVNQRRNFKLPGEFPGSVEEFNKKYNLNNEEVPDFMEIPVEPFAPEKRDPREGFVPDEDDLAFLKNFTKSMKA
jgi:hypothetical protein|tara:strand:- start:217 stop:624 length:408 start_codon:yes stop_codon:yes gene_type:complete